MNIADAFYLNEQIKRLQKQNNWLGIIHLLEPYCRPDAPGWHDTAALSSLGFAYTQLKRFREAEQVYFRWIEIEPDRAQPFYCLGYVHYLKEDWREALRWFEEALRLYPDYFVCLYRYGYAFYKFNKPRKALEPLQKARRIYESFNDEDWLRRNRKNYIKVRFLLAKVHFQCRQFREALAEMEQVLQLDEKGVIEQEHKLYEMGKFHHALGQHQTAIQYLKQALNPRFPQPYILDRLGRVHHDRGDYDEALNCYGRALKIRRLPFILVNRAKTFRAQNRISLALKDLHEALKRDKKGRHKIYLELARIHLDLNKMVEMRHYLEAAIRFKQEVYNADYAEAHYLYVFYYLKMGDKDSARRELQLALQINPNLEWDTELQHILGPVAVEQPEDYMPF